MCCEYGRILFFVLLVAVVDVRSNKCTSLKNVLLLVHHRYGDPFNITNFSGCIERVAFNNKSLTEITIRNQNVTYIGQDTIRHMVRLKTIVFSGCPVQSISVGAFRNVPRLQNVQISYGELTVLPSEVFKEVPALQLLRLNDNKIATIEEKALSNLSNLKRLYMGKNKVKLWDPSWFLNSTALEIVDFQKNEIEVIPRRAFYGMKNLKELFLDYNEIKTIESEAFKSVRHLDYLGLRYNRLTTIHERAFPNKLSVESLNINANYLNYLSKNVMQQLSVRELTLDGNPWTCPCLDKIHHWLHSDNATLRATNMCTGGDIPSCVFPSNHTNTCSESVDEPLTKLYLKTIKDLKYPLDKLCARLN